MKLPKLNQLPEAQQRNALLAIALGYKIDYTNRCSGSSEWAFGVHPTYMTTSVWLHDWRPAGDGALMWQLVCELATIEYGVTLTVDLIKFPVLDRVYPTETIEQALIAAYIAADPKGLIEKWRKENE